MIDKSTMDRIFGYAILSLLIISTIIGLGSAFDAEWLRRISSEEKMQEAEIMKNYGDDFRARRKYRAAIEQYQHALERNPDYGDAMLGIGISYLELGYIPEGERWLRKSLKNDPVLPDIAYAGLAGVNVKRGEYRKAKEMLKIAATLGPEPTDHLLKLSTIYLQLGESDSARACLAMVRRRYVDVKAQYRSVLEFARNHQRSKGKSTEEIDSFLRKGITDEDVKNFDVELFAELYRQTDRWATIEQIYARSCANTGNYHEAIRHLEKARSVQPDNGAILADLNNYRQNLASR